MSTEMMSILRDLEEVRERLHQLKMQMHPASTLKNRAGRLELELQLCSQCLQDVEERLQDMQDD